MKNCFIHGISFILALIFVISFFTLPVDSNALEPLAADPDTAKRFFSEVTSKLTTGESNIDVSGFNFDKDTFVSYMSALYNYEPMSFLIATNFNYTHNKTIVTGLQVTNNFSPDLAVMAMSRFKADVNNCIKGIHGDWSDEAKLLYVYDYIANNFVYDETLSSSGVYSLITERRGVCQSFTLFASAVLTALGFTHDTVVSESINHIWNRVKLGGQWYNIDFTWSNLNVLGNCNHDYFLRSDRDGGLDTDFKVKHTGDDDWQAAIYGGDDSDDDIYVNANTVWYDTDTSFVFANGYWYYLASTKKNRTELRRTDDFHMYESLYSFGDYFITDSGSHWSGYWGGIKALGTKVLFTTASGVHVFDTVSETLIKYIYSYEGPETNAIYGMKDNGDSVSLYIRNYPPTGGAGSDVNDVESVEFEIPEEYREDAELRNYAEKLQYFYDSERGIRLIFGVSEGDFPGTLMAALGGYATNVHDREFSKSAVLTTGSIFRMGRFEYLLSIPGDTDCDGAVSEKDAAYLLSSMLNPDYFPLVYTQDYDGSGTVNTDDVVYLNLAAKDPEGHPLKTR